MSEKSSMLSRTESLSLLPENEKAATSKSTDNDKESEHQNWDQESLPPAYESIFGHFKDAKDTSDSSFDFLKQTLEMFAGTLGCTASLMILLALPMTMVIIGAKYKDDCPVEPFIPIYLIVGGAFGMLKTVLVICQRSARGELVEVEDHGEEDQSMSSKFVDGVLNLFLFIWFIAGNIWVYSKYKPNFQPLPHQPFNYCHPTLYLFAFWVITASYILMGLICFCICCLGMCASCTAYFVTNAG